MVAIVTVSARADVTIGISLPPPIVFAAPPDVIVIPDTSDVYVIPTIAADVFFWNGWWWRLWQNNWYYSQYYDRDWVYYNNIPRFYFEVDPNWRTYYRRHYWCGYRWDYEHIPFTRFERHWRDWHEHRYWEQQRRWGIPHYRPIPERQLHEMRQQRQEQYERKFNVQQRYNQPHPPQPMQHVQQPRPEQQLPQQHVQQPRPEQQLPQQPRP